MKTIKEILISLVIGIVFCGIVVILSGMTNYFTAQYFNQDQAITYEPRHFYTVEEYYQWAEDTCKGIIFEGRCWDRYERLANEAHRQGYAVYVLILQPYQYERVYGYPPTPGWDHAIFVTKIDWRLILYCPITHKTFDYKGVAK
jgi:hypothetical protein